MIKFIAKHVRRQPDWFIAAMYVLFWIGAFNSVMKILGWFF